MYSLYNDIRRRLAALYGEGEARAVTFLLLEEGFGVSRTEIYADKVRDFSQAETRRLRDMLGRLLAGEPVQYVLGKAAFLGRRFKVSPAVLIPRPETEELAAWAVETAGKTAAGAAARVPLRILDAGTGSGCIAVSVKLGLPAAEVSAWDISPAALAVAADNAETLGAAVRFAQRDMLAPWPEAAEEGGKFSLIVSNPPYICEREKSGMEAVVLDNEPPAALFVPDGDPLLFYRALARGAARALLPGGWLLVEANRAYARQTAALFSGHGLREVTVRRDAYGNERMVGARRPL